MRTVLILALVVIAILLAIFAFKSFGTRNGLQVDPHAARQIEKAQRR